jgi:hypothetical protein
MSPNTECEKKHRLCINCDYYRPTNDRWATVDDRCARKRKIRCNLVSGKKEEVGRLMYADSEREADIIERLTRSKCGPDGIFFKPKCEPKSI